MAKILETANCVKNPGMLMLSTFESMSGNPIICVTFIDASGKVALRETAIHTAINESHMREFFGDQIAKHG